MGWDPVDVLVRRFGTHIEFKRWLPPSKQPCSFVRVVLVVDGDSTTASRYLAHGLINERCLKKDSLSCGLHGKRPFCEVPLHCAAIESDEFEHT